MEIDYEYGVDLRFSSDFFFAQNAARDTIKVVKSLRYDVIVVSSSHLEGLDTNCEFYTSTACHEFVTDRP